MFKAYLHDSKKVVSRFPETAVLATSAISLVPRLLSAWARERAWYTLTAHALNITRNLVICNLLYSFVTQNVIYDDVITKVVHSTVCEL